MDKKRRKQIKQTTLNYYREKANSNNWNLGLVEYLEQFCDDSEIDYGCFIAKKFIDRVQISSLLTSKQIAENIINEIYN